MNSEDLIESLIDEIRDETMMSYQDAKDLLSLLFNKMRECENNIVTGAICTDF